MNNTPLSICFYCIHMFRRLTLTFVPSADLYKISADICINKSAAELIVTLITSDCKIFFGILLSFTGLSQNYVTADERIFATAP